MMPGRWVEMKGFSRFEIALRQLCNVLACSSGQLRRKEGFDGGE
jgi:hypothetical protein